MQIGSIARLSTLLTGLSNPATVTGQTDGKHTDLTFSPDDSVGFRQFNAVDGMFAGETVHINAKPEVPAGSRDVVIHMQNNGGDVAVDLTVTEKNAIDGCTGVNVDGRIDGQPVNLEWNLADQRLQGKIGGQDFSLTANSPDISSDDNPTSAKGSMAGTLGQSAVALSSLAHLRTLPNHFGIIAETAFDVRGTIGNVTVNEVETPADGFLTW